MHPEPWDGVVADAAPFSSTHHIRLARCQATDSAEAGFVLAHVSSDVQLFSCLAHATARQSSCGRVEGSARTTRSRGSIGTRSARKPCRAPMSSTSAPTVGCR